MQYYKLIFGDGINWLGNQYIRARNIDDAVSYYNRLCSKYNLDIKLCSINCGWIKKLFLFFIAKKLEGEELSNGR